MNEAEQRAETFVESLSSAWERGWRAGQERTAGKVADLLYQLAAVKARLALSLEREERLLRLLDEAHEKQAVPEHVAAKAAP